MPDKVADIYQLEESLRKELEQLPEFKNWQSVKITIDLLEKTNLRNGTALSSDTISERVSPTKVNIEIPSDFDINDPWDKKILFVINKRKEGTRDEILKDLRNLGVTGVEKNLLKRISTYSTLLELAGLIKKERLEDGRIKYIIKKTA